MDQQRCCLGLIITYEAYFVLHRSAQDIVRVSKLILRDPSSSLLHQQYSRLNVSNSPFIDPGISVLQLFVALGAAALRNYMSEHGLEEQGPQRSQQRVCWKKTLSDAVSVGAPTNCKAVHDDGNSGSGNRRRGRSNRGPNAPEAGGPSVESSMASTEAKEMDQGRDAVDAYVDTDIGEELSLGDALENATAVETSFSSCASCDSLPGLTSISEAEQDDCRSCQQLREERVITPNKSLLPVSPHRPLSLVQLQQSLLS